MISFFSALVLLVVGYLTYGRVVERLFGIADNPTPAITQNDGVDFVPMATWRAFLVELLDIAGTGPIFGALMGAVFGPIVFLWIVFGSILGGAVHDFCAGMLSVRNGGKTIAEITGIYLGKTMLWVMRVFIVVLLVLVGTVFVTSPAQLFCMLTPADEPLILWVAIILAYYLVATVVPIDKIIGRVYPIFGAILILMAVLVTVGLFVGGYSISEIDFVNHHAQGLPVWPFMFITVACGAISGFHATQAPLISRCIKSERNGRCVFYGAMIAEGVIALVWAAAGVGFYENSAALQASLTALGQSGTVYEISVGLLGSVGGVLAIIGVAICPITSGDTAFRSARLTLADCIGLDQVKYRNRFLIAIPMFVIAAILSQLDFNVIWRYFSWSNQTLAMLVLWVASVFLWRYGKNRWAFLITAVPATFMSAVTSTYILMASEGFGLSASIAYPCGFAFALLCVLLYIVNCKRHCRTTNHQRS